MLGTVPGLIVSQHSGKGKANQYYPRGFNLDHGTDFATTKWLTFDADVSLSQSRFRDNERDAVTGVPIGRRIPGSVESVVAAGATVHDLEGFSGGLRLRYFGPRALIENNSARSGETLLLTALAGYEFNRQWSAQAEIFNVLNRRVSAIDYFYTFRLRASRRRAWTMFTSIRPSRDRCA